MGIRPSFCFIFIIVLISACLEGRAGRDSGGSFLDAGGLLMFAGIDGTEQQERYHQDCVTLCHHGIDCIRDQAESRVELRDDEIVAELEDCIQECKSGIFQFTDPEGRSVSKSLSDMEMSAVIACLTEASCEDLYATGGYPCLRYARQERDECNFCRILADCETIEEPITGRPVNLELEDCLDACITTFDKAQWFCLTANVPGVDLCEHFHTRMITCYY